MRVGKPMRLGTYRLAESFSWYGLSFKYIAPKRGRTKHGFQVDCPRRSHWRVRPRTTCSWSLTFTSPADEAYGIRKLKWWALRGFDCSCKKTHSDLKKMSFASMPVDEELERLGQERCPADRVPTPPASCDEEQPLKRRRVKPAAKASKGSSSSSSSSTSSSSKSSGSDNSTGS
eukprot:2252319-Karenia_brevis.AAC.1